MKKSLNKVIVTLAAVAALSMAMGATAMADVTADRDETTGVATVTYTREAQPNEQVTLLLLKPDADIIEGIGAEDIAYIDQVAANSDGVAEFKNIKLANVAENAKYTVMSGSASGAPIEEDVADFSAGGESIGKLGDVNGDGTIAVADASKVVDVVLKKATFTAEEEARADMNKDKVMAVADASSIVDVVLKKVVVDEDVYLD